MSIRCPHCNHVMELKGVKPGRFHPRCTACQQKFLLVISPDANVAPQVAIEHDPKAETVSPAIASVLGVTNDAGPRVTQPAKRAAPARSAASTQATMAPAPGAAAVGMGSPAPDLPPVTHAHRQTTHAHVSDDVSQHADAQSAALPFESTDPVHAGNSLGGYLIEQKLGEGGMGSVYLARQMSLDRNVALKVLAPSLATDPAFVARFTREAYAAAQLSHHNVVQIHDIGADHDLHFFSMEFVEGKTLSSVVTESGKVEAEQAVGFILQAARGLKYAHDHGLIHRDIKPENLLLNEQGIVKVADLGLVKRAGMNETALTAARAGRGASPDAPIDKTQADMSMGTPAYMAPEQAQDAAAVDQRADIYSLGCTMYDLLTGRPPFTGRTAMEVITKHQREQIVPPDVIVKNVPKTLSAILMKMVAKKPEQRFQTMTDVIKALEDFLGVATTGPFTPKEEHVKVLEFAVERFNNSKWARIRMFAIIAFYVVCAALAVFVGMAQDTPLRKVQFTGAFIGLAVLTTLAYQITTGITQRTPVFLKFRQLLFGANLTDWLMWAAALIFICTVLVVFEQHIGWLIVVGIAVLLAAAFHFTIDLALNKEQATPIVQTEAMLKQMRLRGLDENSIRQFVSKFSGKKWEAFYEALFGYEAKMQARVLWGRGERGLLRPKSGAWRDPIISVVEARLSMRREARERRHLARVETKALKAKGIRDDLARKQARKNAETIVSRAEKLRSTSIKRAAVTMTPGATVVDGSGNKSVLISKDVALEGAIASILRGGGSGDNAIKQRHGGETETDEEYERTHESWFKRRYGTPLDLLLGQMVRFLLAVVVLATFTLWFKQNSGDRYAKETVETIRSRREVGDITNISVKGVIKSAQELGVDAKQGVEKVAEKTGNAPLQPFPRTWETLNRWSEPFGGWNAGLAGALLLFSAFFCGRIMAVLVMFSAMVSMWGYRFELPVVGYPATWMAAVAAILLWIFAVMFFREREGY